jgi:hypothetical protein
LGAESWTADDLQGAEALKIILSTCPIHTGCTIEVAYGDEADGRIPSPDPALKRDAERDFPDLVPVKVIHLESKLRSS